MRVVLLATLLVALFATPTQAADPAATNVIAATVIDIVDGDTVKVDMHLLPGLRQSMSIRVDGVDTPESGFRARCTGERDRAAAAKAFTRAAVGPDGGAVNLTGIRAGKFAGRLLADILTGSERASLRDALIAAGHARPYDGGQRQGWC